MSLPTLLQKPYRGGGAGSRGRMDHPTQRHSFPKTEAEAEQQKYPVFNLNPPSPHQ